MFLFSWQDRGAGRKWAFQSECGSRLTSGVCFQPKQSHRLAPWRRRSCTRKPTRLLPVYIRRSGFARINLLSSWLPAWKVGKCQERGRAGVVHSPKVRPIKGMLGQASTFMSSGSGCGKSTNATKWKAHGNIQYKNIHASKVKVIILQPADSNVCCSWSIIISDYTTSGIIQLYLKQLLFMQVVQPSGSPKGIKIISTCSLTHNFTGVLPVSPITTPCDHWKAAIETSSVHCVA